MNLNSFVTHFKLIFFLLKKQINFQVEEFFLIGKSEKTEFEFFGQLLPLKVVLAQVR